MISTENLLIYASDQHIVLQECCFRLVSTAFEVHRHSYLLNVMTMFNHSFEEEPSDK